MFEIIKKTNFDFVGKRYWAFAVSGILILSGIASLVMKGGPKWGLDFTGGNLIEIQFADPPSLEEMRAALSGKGIPSFELQSVPSEGIYIVRTQLQGRRSPFGGTDPADPAGPRVSDMGERIRAIVAESFPDRSPVLLRKEFVGPTVGAHLFKQTSLAFILTFVGIIIYVAFRFHSGVWGVAGVVALIHDVFATIGVFSILDKEITVTVVAALLTIAGYSINDTIVIFDYLREKLRLLRTEPLNVVINRSVNDTLSRTLITNLMVLLVVLTLYFFGGEVIHDFAFAMVFGAIVGTYSSIGIATPFIYEWERVRGKRKS
ncbi:MAG: protein-export membrane protein SecF [Elusimicrobia bacterium RIFCSPLOWO2_01_FULL_64_13]|nr:MAG: protein-export membrane protein SecF [Elusimicrobia bacterium RIFCSPLOWO2_01_FULL_64_13]